MATNIISDIKSYYNQINLDKRTIAVAAFSSFVCSTVLSCNPIVGLTAALYLLPLQ